MYVCVMFLFCDQYYVLLSSAVQASQSSMSFFKAVKLGQLVSSMMFYKWSIDACIPVFICLLYFFSLQQLHRLSSWVPPALWNTLPINLSSSKLYSAGIFFPQTAALRWIWSIKDIFNILYKHYSSNAVIISFFLLLECQGFTSLQQHIPYKNALFSCLLRCLLMKLKVKSQLFVKCNLCLVDVAFNLCFWPYILVKFKNRL